MKMQQLGGIAAPGQALPLLHAQKWSRTARRALPQVHLINPLWDCSGGSEWRTLSLYQELRAQCEPHLWSRYTPDPELAKRYSIRRISASALDFPKSGTFVFVGVYFRYGKWIYLTRPQRIIIVYNTFEPELLALHLHRLSLPGFPRVEVVYASEDAKQSAGYPGVVEPSPIDLEGFTPSRLRKPEDPMRPFTIGRLSRDVLEKHHPNDAALYRRLADMGARVRVMGGTCLQKSLEGVPSIALLRTFEEDAARFLQSLDCFYYRTSDQWVETYGRVVVEAMACGLPVVCHRTGGYARFIENGRNGFLFETEAEALDIIRRLKGDHGLRETIGRAARRTVEELYSPARRRKTLEFYVPQPRWQYAGA